MIGRILVGALFGLLLGSLIGIALNWVASGEFIADNLPFRWCTVLGCAWGIKKSIDHEYE